MKIAVGRGADAVGDAATAAALAEHDPEAKLVSQEATVAKALAYVAQNQAALAIQDLTALRDANPDLAIARVGLGRAYAADRQTDLAIVELQKAVQLDPSNAEAQYQLGYVNHLIKRDAAAAASAPTRRRSHSSRPIPITGRSSGPRWPRPTCPTAPWPS